MQMPRQLESAVELAYINSQRTETKQHHITVEIAFDK